MRKKKCFESSKRLSVRFMTTLLMLFCCGQIMQAQNKLTMFVGTYTDGSSKGLYSFSFNQTTGESVLLDSLEMQNPSYLMTSRYGRLVYAVSETNDEKASLNIIRLDEEGGMHLLDSEPTDGADPCYVAVKGGIALTANYSGGSMSVFHLREGGTKALFATSFFGDTGGPDTLRQQVPHVHIPRRARGEAPHHGFCHLFSSRIRGVPSVRSLPSFTVTMLPPMRFSYSPS